MYTLIIIFTLIAVSLSLGSPLPPATPLPLIIWHGLGDNYDADGLKAVGDLADKAHPGTYVYNIRLDDDPSQDRSATFFGNLTVQVQQVCDTLATHPVLSTAPAVNAVGFSQGGQFLRAYIERCNVPPVRNLVTFGSQHNGIAKFQECGDSDWVCKAWLGLLKTNTWSLFVQNRLVPAQYYRDAAELDNYLEHSNFLADVNNERKVKNETYARNLASLEHFAMYIFDKDTTVIPKESAWFAEVNTTTGKVTPLNERKIYQEDWLGLKKLDEKGGLHFRVAEGGHMELSDALLLDAFKTYLAPPMDVDWVHVDVLRVQYEL
ncbi:MAG: hypothetical protein M1817_004695 [Caeruleum heppii]|nr:MAG: hypothetical protein M1817_004695 [Caeruleum heppii]